MTITTVVPLLTTPVADDQDVGTFAERAQVNFLEVNPIMTAVNDLVVEINAERVEMNGVAADALASAEQSEIAAQSSASSANYVGPWVDLTGALSVPSSVSHNDDIWILTENVADVTTHTPGVSAVWQSLGANRGGDYNIIINPEFTINQRGNAPGSAGPGYYYFDRWRSEVSSTVSVDYDDEQNTRVLNITAGRIMQGIETARIVGEHGASGVDLVLTWEGTATGGLSFNGAAYTATGSGHVFSIPNGALATGVYVFFSSGTVSKAQLARRKFYGIPFLRRDPTSELQLCKRYYQSKTLTNNAEPWSFIGQALTATQCRFLITFDPPMRIPPGSFAPGQANLLELLVAGVPRTLTGFLSIASATETTGVLDVTVASGLTAGHCAFLRKNATAGTFHIGFSAEL